MLKRIFRSKKKSPFFREVFDLPFNTPVGIFDFHDPFADRCNVLADDGFSFVEIGPITPEAQHGILFNRGAEALASRMRKRKQHRACIIANICKNPSTDIELALPDYEHCFNILYDHVDIFNVNLADEHVPGIRQLQEITYLSDIIDKLLEQRMLFNDYKPILIEISEDLTRTDLDDLIHYVRSSGVDGLVCSSLAQVRYISEKAQGRLPIIAKAYFKSVGEAKEFLDAGAALLELKGFSAGFRLQSFRYRLRRSLAASAQRK